MPKPKPELQPKPNPNPKPSPHAFALKASREPTPSPDQVRLLSLEASGDLRSWEIALSQASGVEASPRGAVRVSAPLPRRAEFSADGNLLLTS